MRTIFHMTTAAEWEAAQALGRYEADTLRTEGFIHLSRPAATLMHGNSPIEALFLIRCWIQDLSRFVLDSSGGELWSAGSSQLPFSWLNQLSTGSWDSARSNLRETKGHSSAYLWVLKDNPTVDFYRRMGGVQLGSEKTVDLGGPLQEIAFEWRL